MREKVVKRLPKSVINRSQDQLEGTVIVTIENSLRDDLLELLFTYFYLVLYYVVIRNKRDMNMVGNCVLIKAAERFISAEITEIDSFSDVT